VCSTHLRTFYEHPMRHRHRIVLVPTFPSSLQSLKQVNPRNETPPQLNGEESWRASSSTVLAMLLETDPASVHHLASNRVKTISIAR
jgi:hypothetical protein